MTSSFASHYDLQRAPELAHRAADWRNGALVYQVLVDRFAPPENLEAKRHVYAPPRKLRKWNESPQRGTFLSEHDVWSHEVDFWGGDLRSLGGRLDHVQGLGADVLYLNPIHQALTNHKYDAQDYFAVSPEYGTRDDLNTLADDLHRRGMKLVLDGVFNHVGRSSSWFQEAMKDADSPKRSWFDIDPRYKLGYRAWANVANLPELRLENPAVQARVFRDPDSVVQGYLRDGVDGWRLDVASDIGFAILADLTRAAHDARPGSLVIGEIWSYPDEWSPAMDAVMNFHARQIILHLVQGALSGPRAGHLIDRMIADTGLGPILKSWLILDNHDTPRLKTMLPKPWQQRMAQVLQFTLPGSPCVYYGVEVGMAGGHDPQMRGPMRWDLVNDRNQDLTWLKTLIALRCASRAMRIGDFRRLDSEHLLAFMRRTDRVAETAVVVANAADKPVTEVLTVPESKFINNDLLRDRLGRAEGRVSSGMLQIAVPAQTACVLMLSSDTPGDHNPHKRVQ